jgi:uncharacterized protein with FMN-binding domain
MRAHKVVPVLAMLAGIVLPAVLTIVLLSIGAVAGAVGAVSRSKSRVSGAPITQSTPTSGRSGTFSGPVVQGFFGPVQAVLTVSGGKITNVRITAPQDNPTSAYINSQVVPLLRSETIQAQSANINGISGASVTSQAYYQSLLGALKAANL